MPVAKIKARLEELCARGGGLYLRLWYECDAAAFQKNEKLLETVKKLPRFADSYQSWYTEALELLRQTFPSRVDDFVGYLNPPKTRKEITWANYTISDALRNLRVTHGLDVVVERDAAKSPMQQQVKIIESVRDGIDSVLVNLRSELQANLFDHDLDAARELNGKGYRRAAGMMAGVVIESHLRETADRHQIRPTAKNPTIATLNDALKEAGILGLQVWRRVQAVGDVRNQCGHKTATEPTKDDVARMIDVADLIKRIA